MAVGVRKGNRGEVLLAFKNAYGTDITAYSKVVPHSFPFVSTTLNPLLEFIQSDSKTRTGSQPDRIISQESGGGDLVMEVLPTIVPYLILAALNPDNANYNHSSGDPLDKTAYTVAAQQNAFGGQDVTPTAFNGTENVSTAASNAFPDITFSTPKSFGMFPAVLTVTFSTAKTTAGTITVSGTRSNGIAASSTKPFSKTYDIASAQATTAIDLGEDCWQSISNVSFNGFGSTVTGTATIGRKASVKNRTFNLNSNGTQSPGLDIQLVLDQIPSRLRRAIINSLSINISDTVRATLGIIASNFTRFAMLNSDAEKLVYDNTVTGANLNSTNFPVPDLDFYTPLGGMFEVGTEMTSSAAANTFSAIGSTLVGRDLTVDINHNYEDATGFTGVLGGGQPRDSDTGLVITAAATVDYTTGTAAADTFIKWQEDARNGTKRAIRSRFFGVDANGKKTILEFLMRSCELTEMPAIDSADRGTIPVSLNYEAKAPSGATSPNELNVQTWT